MLAAQGLSISAVEGKVAADCCSDWHHDSKDAKV